MSAAVSIPPRPMSTFSAGETVTFTTRQAAYTYVESRVWAHMHAHGADQSHPDYDAVVDAVADRVYGDDHTVSLRGVETLVQNAVVSLLY